MLEREVKIRLDEEKLRDLTNSLGGLDYFEQTNIIYNLPEGFLRLRKEKDTTIITYKGERLDDKFGSREEIEFKLDKSQFLVLQEVFASIGLKETLRFNKTRAEYTLPNSKLFIDKLPTGSYLEIEAKTDYDILDTMQRLGFTESDIEHKSYFELVRGSQQY